jgi:type IV secretory pathway VirB4 component
MFILHKSNNKESSRKQINIKGVSDDILILPNNEYRAIVRVSSINFELKSEAEQDSLTAIYQSFLNSLPCPLQIMFRVREMNLDKYLESFSTKLKNEKQVVYQKQISSYCDFVHNLVADNKILTRSFYIVVPFKGELTNDIESAHEHLNLYIGIISKGLTKLGMQVTRLTSLEILDLFYSFYNPEQAKIQTITDQTLHLIKQSYL